MTAAQLTVEGMTCSGCSNRLKRVLEGQDGIHAAGIVLETRQVSIDYDSAIIDPGTIENAIVDAGFSVVHA